MTNRKFLVIDLGTINLVVGLWYIIVPLLMGVTWATMGAPTAGVLSLGCAGLVFLIGHMPTEHRTETYSVTPPFPWFSFLVLVTVGVDLSAGFIPAAIICVGLIFFERWWKQARPLFS